MPQLPSRFGPFGPWFWLNLLQACSLHHLLGEILEAIYSSRSIYHVLSYLILGLALVFNHKRGSKGSGTPSDNVSAQSGARADDTKKDMQRKGRKRRKR
jgi:hypothetical protein